MGILTDVIIADPTEATSLLKSGYPFDGHVFVDMKNVTQVEYASLYSRLVGKPFDVRDVDLFEVLAQEGDEGPWVYRFPDLIREAIGNSTQAQLREATNRMIDEEKPLAYPPDEWREMNSQLPDAFEQVRSLARKSIEGGKPILLYVSL